ncbi:tRNA-specific adenosine deaminase [Tessaracoccus aquimaris]|uniref:tRNA-specific adenosine deaminase n=1 Tax=Tessaracoccus aquimaris TaxID=1332264 RepID=A0A1Q2CM57_9ACTN|nr:nucleoside deaminase [Tessaracoccus aquimaris]AQP47187.1 tRNA-specific adenosine deaminase [Tessaracoccus aquimaris]
MTISDPDRRFLTRAVDLAEAAVESGEEPFGSLLVSPTGEVLFEDHNRTGGGDATRHPEFEIARWAASNLEPAERAACVVYTSGEHCPMCAAAHAWAGLGRIVYASSSAQLVEWLTAWGVEPAPVAPLPIAVVAPAIQVDGPEPSLTERVRSLQRRHLVGSQQSPGST